MRGEKREGLGHGGRRRKRNQRISNLSQNDVGFYTVRDPVHSYTVSLVRTEYHRDPIEKERVLDRVLSTALLQTTY